MMGLTRGRGAWFERGGGQRDEIRGEGSLRPWLKAGGVLVILHRRLHHRLTLDPNA